MIDADESLELLLQWPLVVVIHDCFYPLLAGIIVETISEQSEETLEVMRKWAGEAARREVNAN